MRTAIGAFSAIALLAAGCAAGDPLSTTAAPTSSAGAGGGGGASAEPCVPGKAESCTCTDGAQGAQVCNEDGTRFGRCECSGSGGGASDTCGDGECLDDESCDTCERDCGACVPCTIAPSCDGAMIPPPSMSPVSELGVTLEAMPPEAILARLTQAVADAGPGVRMVAAALAPARPDEQAVVAVVRDELAKSPAAEAAVRRQLARAGLIDAPAFRVAFPEPEEPVLTPMDEQIPPGGTLECGAPLLRLRVARIKVFEEDDDVYNDIVYCSIAAEGADGSELRVTPPTPNLDEGDSFELSLESGTFWGQRELRRPGGHLIVTYDCFEADSNDGYATLLSAIAGAAKKAGGIAGGESGWIFSVVGAVMPLISAALALDSDDHLLNASQIIPAERHMELTNGAKWSVRKSGTNVWSDWEWALRIEAWGCAERGTL